MNKVALVVGGIIVILILAVSPFICGIAIESQFNQRNQMLKDNLNDIFVDIDNIESTFSRGWFSSTAKIKIDVKNSTVIINQHITNGPWAYFGLGKVEYQLELNGTLKTYSDIIFSDKSPLTAVEKISFDGSSILKILSPWDKIKPAYQKIIIAFLQGTQSIKADIMVGKRQISLYVEAMLTDKSSDGDISTLMQKIKSRLFITVSPRIPASIINELKADNRKDKIIQSLISNDRFILDNGLYSAKFEFKNGQLLTNGKPDLELMKFLIATLELPKGML